MAAAPAPGPPVSARAPAAPPRQPGDTTGIVVVAASSAHARRAPSAEPGGRAKVAAPSGTRAAARPLGRLAVLTRARPMNALVALAALTVLVLAYLVIRH
jgi:hypothetical protein